MVLVFMYVVGLVGLVFFNGSTEHAPSHSMESDGFIFTDDAENAKRNSTDTNPPSDSPYAWPWETAFEYKLREEQQSSDEYEWYKQFDHPDDQGY